MNFLIIFIKIAVAIVVLLLAVMLLTLVERRLLAFIQDRLGPNRLGPQGLFQPVADAIKLVLKEDIVPANADKFLHALAPSIAVFLAVAAVLIIPVGDRMTIAGYNIHWVISDVGILYFLAASSLAIYAILFAGWGSSNKYSMYGALRSVAQMISYELSMGLAVVGAVLLWGSLSLSDMVRAQGLGNLKELVWFIMAMPLFGVFFITGLAETNRAPFDL
ncbi:MAG: complex I subunit 1 family protein, partial [bacterium]